MRTFVPKALKLTLLVSLVGPMLTGCWDRLEIDDRAVVLGIGIDAAESEEQAGGNEDEVNHLSGSIPLPVHDMIRVTVQIALPGRIPLGPGEGGGKSSDVKQTVWVLDVIGHSVDDALMNLQQQISSRLFFGHLRVIVISEKIAVKGIQNINDYFRRNSEVRRMAWMIVSKGDAKALMEAAPKLERIPTLSLMTMLDDGVRMGKFPKDYIGIFWSHSSKLGQEGFLPYVELKKQDRVEVSGVAFFHGVKMTGKSKPLEIAGYLGIRGINPAGYRTYVSLDGPESTIMMNTTHRQAKIKTTIRNGKPFFRIRIALDMNVEEKMSNKTHINELGTIHTIERKQEQSAVKYYEDYLAKTQQLDSDICGFGEFVRAKLPGYWNKQVKTKEKWQELYKDVEFDVQVNVKVRRIGMKAI